MSGQRKISRTGRAGYQGRFKAGYYRNPGFLIGAFNPKTGEIKGEVLSGAQPYNVFKKTLDKYLSGKKTYDQSYLRQALENIEDPRILVIGDLMLDHYSWGKWIVFSGSSYSCYESTREDQRLGGRGML
ncbi:MAG: hypothetical protein CM1200mP30_09770 [Pseudomonadota bacterium]|nr:MAG: hypothetical protein CM1200mP30_09770 [Pseudomonadota bacterium]